MTKPEQAGVREKLLDELFKLYGVNQRGEHYTLEESDQYEKVADELLSLVEATCLEVIDWGSWMVDHCYLHEKYTSACCNCQKEKYALEMNEQREAKQRQALSKLLGRGEEG